MRSKPIGRGLREKFLLIAVSITFIAAYSFRSASDEKSTEAKNIIEKSAISSSTKQQSRQLPKYMGEAAALRNITDKTDSEPHFININSIGVNAQIRPVGVTSQLQFDVPSADAVGWYKHSSPIAGSGTTVLAAHVDYDDEKGAFFHLSDLAEGDTISLTSEEGKLYTYRVISNKDYQKDGLPVEDLFDKAGPHRLHLITCGGSFDQQKKSYTENVVVTAIFDS